ncbi:MAG: hypothetical protein ISN26_05730 [Betaproteobacteria bacterium AqS2]|uniref:Uncharacterized protein n=1 Tax=Candidatus Amphirhobacter heronislandensis TaxID=1732024 RepID=A0A930UHX5_9GAMM|nr:hypothetical protein [Betaproteobacteria bacterium AqS2]
MAIFEEHGSKDHEYASTLKTSAILIATIAGLWFGSVPVSASTNVDKPVEVQPIPNPDDCTGPNYSVAGRLRSIVHKYNVRHFSFPNYTLDEFHTEMNSVLIKPELINCKIVTIGHHYYNGHTFINAMLNGGWYPASIDAYIEATKWALSKGYDLSIKVDNPLGPWAFHHGKTAAEMAKGMLQYYSKYKDSDDLKWPGVFTITYREVYTVYKKLVDLLEPPLAPATKSCAEMDGQTPPANEYCIVAENLQSSISVRSKVADIRGRAMLRPRVGRSLILRERCCRRSTRRYAS